MRSLLPSLHIDALSFWMGIVTASLLLWFLYGLRQLWPALKSTVLYHSDELRRMSSISLEERLRQEAIRRAQASHVAFSLFSLDEILVEPRLLAPPPQADPPHAPESEDIVAQAVLYTPDWPELAAVYKARTISLFDPLSTGENILITGQPGAGKTTALAAIVSTVARRESPDEALNQLIPIFVHAAGLDTSPGSGADMLKPLVSQLIEGLPRAVAPQLPEFLSSSCREGKILILLDGADELPAARLRELSAYLEAFLRQYPAARLVMTCTPEYWDSLVDLEIRPFALAHWGPDQVTEFLKKWGTGWAEVIALLEPKKVRPADPQVLTSWLREFPLGTTPLEWTLTAWAAFSGDLLGRQPVDAIESWAARISDPAYRPALEQLALEAALRSELVFQETAIPAAFSANIAESAGETKPGSMTPDGSSGSQAPADGNDNRIPVRFLVENGVLAELPGNRYRFSHPVLAGYLAACGLKTAPDQAARLVPQQGWTGKYLALRYSGVFTDVGWITNPVLADTAEPLFKNLFILARWLKEPSGAPEWKNQVIRRLAQVVQSDGISQGIRQRALSALIISHDPILPALFKQHLASKSWSTVQLAALGAGAIGDTRLAQDLLPLLGSQNRVLAASACLALISIGTGSSIEAIARTLLNGNENARRAAAEALANRPREGYPILREGSVLTDLLVRRAVVFGLARVREKWALETLEKMRIEDGQWVVRNAAAQTVEDLQKPDPHIPRRLPPAAQSPWLIAFASRQGTGIAGDSPATDVLLLALKMGSEEERLAAVDYLRRRPQPDVIENLYHVAMNGQGAVREASINALLDFAAQGVTMPPPEVFGLGKVLTPFQPVIPEVKS